jgi:hypothetical protein
MVNHLYQNYGMIAHTELTANYVGVMTPYDPKLPSEYVYTQLKDGVSYAIEGN